MNRRSAAVVIEVLWWTGDDSMRRWNGHSTRPAVSGVDGFDGGGSCCC